MYISRVVLDTSAENTGKLISSPYRMHAAIEKSFPPKAARHYDDGERVLWRLDQNPVYDDFSTTKAYLYIVSPETPDLSVIARQCSTLGIPSTKSYDPVMQALKDGQTWRFRLKANATRSQPRDRGAHGRVHGCMTATSQMTWLLDRCAKHGFRVDANDVLISQSDVEQFSRHDASITISTVTYDGMLIVTDANALRQALERGIGRSKGFGCGLLTIAPAA